MQNEYDMMHYDRGFDAGKRFLAKLDEFRQLKDGTPIIFSLAFVAANDGDEEHIIAESDFIIDNLQEFGMIDIPLFGGMVHGPGNKFEQHVQNVCGRRCEVLTHGVSH